MYLATFAHSAAKDSKQSELTCLGSREDRERIERGSREDRERIERMEASYIFRAESISPRGLVCGPRGRIPF